MYGEMVVYPPMPHESTSSVFVPDAGPSACALRSDSTNVASLRVWWSVRKAVHGGEGMRLPALHSGGQVPALDSDPYLSQLSASGWVAHSAAGLL